MNWKTTLKQSLSNLVLSQSDKSFQQKYWYISSFYLGVNIFKTAFWSFPYSSLSCPILSFLFVPVILYPSYSFLSYFFLTICSFLSYNVLHILFLSYSFLFFSFQAYFFFLVFPVLLNSFYFFLLFCPNLIPILPLRSCHVLS